MKMARDLNLWGETIPQWDNGRRPKWRYMPVLSPMLGIELESVVKKIWGDIPGDSCPCPCGGEKIFPGL